MIRASSLAFTLIEVVLALALGSLLMIALVGVLHSASRQLRQTRPAGELDCDAAFRVLSRDLLLAQTVATRDGWIDLTGSFPVFGDSDKFARRVAYGVSAGIGPDEQVLMRATEQEGQSLASGIARLDIERLDSSGIPQPLSSQASSLAGSVRVWIWAVNSDKPTLQRDLVIH